MEKEKFKLNEKVQFQYWDVNNHVDKIGRGWYKEFDEDNNQAFIQTTRGLIWCEADAVHKIN